MCIRDRCKSCRKCEEACPQNTIIALNLSLIHICTGIINAYNFMDGINGITGGYSLVILAALAYINKEVVTFVEADFIYTVICSVLVFCFFNFRKRAKCFAGDVGSVSIAFILLFLIGRLIIGTGDFSWIVLLSVYGVDSVLTIIHRLMLHENIGVRNAFKPVQRKIERSGPESAAHFEGGADIQCQRCLLYTSRCV